MKINPIITATGYKSDKSGYVKSIMFCEKPKQKGLTKEDKVGIGVFSAMLLGATIAIGIIENKKPPRKSFEKILEENGLEFKDKILIKKENGEKFTGELKRSTGKFCKDKFIGPEMIKTRKFEKGIITEKTYTDWRDREIKGYFYKDGEIKLDVSCVIGKGKRPFGFSDYENGKPTILGDGLIDKGKSVFEWARERIRQSSLSKK